MPGRRVAAELRRSAGEAREELMSPSPEAKLQLLLDCLESSAAMSLLYGQLSAWSIHGKLEIGIAVTVLRVFDPEPGTRDFILTPDEIPCRG